eukprot:scaffold656757_cov36-Prasinocladus_malaysianus.AAC.1
MQSPFEAVAIEPFAAPADVAAPVAAPEESAVPPLPSQPLRITGPRKSLNHKPSRPPPSASSGCRGPSPSSNL